MASGAAKNVLRRIMTRLNIQIMGANIKDIQLSPRLLQTVLQLGDCHSKGRAPPNKALNL